MSLKKAIFIDNRKGKFQQNECNIFQSVLDTDITASLKIINYFVETQQTANIRNVFFYLTSDIFDPD